MTAPKDQSKNQAFCILPWIHMYIDPAGSAFPCCIHNPKSSPFFGSTKTQEIGEVWNSAEFRQFRLDLLDGKMRPDVCDGCYDRETTQHLSHRTQFNAEFAHLIEKSIATTRSDGSIPNGKFAYVDFRISNVCNLKCRSCKPEYSTSWAADFQKAGWVTESKPHSPDKRREILSFYIENIDSIEKVYFAGGEPLIIKEHYELLDCLIEKDRTEVAISYNTNLSVLKWGGNDIVSYWKQFPKIEVSPSIDQIGAKAEYARKGTRWSNVLRNIARIRSELPHVRITPTITVSIFNILEMPQIIDAMMAAGLIDRVKPSFWFNILRGPEYYHVSTLPPDLIKQAQENISQWLAFDPARAALASQFELILEETRKPHQPARLAEFFEMTDKLDALRGERLADVFPELAALR